MGLLDKLKKKVEEQEQKQEKENNQTGDNQTDSRARNKVKDDNIFGDKQAENEGAGGSPKTPRKKSQREAFEKLKGE